MKNKTKELALASILTALSVLITYSPLKLVLPFFTLTLGAHVPTMLAIFVGPWVTVMTIIGSCVGFFLTIPAPNSIIVVARAATHIIFAIAGISMLKKNYNIFVIIIITAILHSLAEGIVVYILTPIILDSATAALAAGGIAAGGTILHHAIDSAITAPILIALTKAKIVKRRYQ
ncbi:MAG TPA: hypothetical protein DCO93_05540 [Clostridiales bacterium]|nr:hypothetical protein [Clostridiales bacterium]